MTSSRVLELERRSGHRRRLMLPARIALACRRSRNVVCTIRDFSETGAQIGTDGRHFLPSEFQLCVAGDQVFDCFVRWRSDNVLGVKFLPTSGRRLPRVGADR